MSPPKSKVFQQSWPLGQSLDLVRGDVEIVARAVRTEVEKFTDGEQVGVDWIRFPGLSTIFERDNTFTNIPTIFYVLPTDSEWTVLWNNSFLCDGYDSLCYCLTHDHGLKTIHWCSHDDTTTFQPGSTFTYRSTADSIVTERNVYCGCNDGRWKFGHSGAPLDEENLELYKANSQKDRFNELVLMELLAKLGAYPWSKNFYDFSSSAYRLERLNYPPRIIKRSREQISINNRGGAA